MMEQESDWVEYLLTRELTSQPGQRFNYNTGVSHLFGHIIEYVSGESCKTFVQSKLFDPWGISIQRWQTDPRGVVLGGKGLFLNAPDFLKLAYGCLQIYEQKLWEPVHYSWLHTCWTQQARGHKYYGTYGMQWWLRHYPQVSAKNPNVYGAVGYGGQMAFIIPDRKECVVFMGNMLGESFDLPFQWIDQYLSLKDVELHT
jgi:CubicO group peptidase (beta-lactamase class C family)